MRISEGQMIMGQKYHQKNAEVLYAKAKIPTLDKSDVENFKRLSSQNTSERIRLCTHTTENDLLHEMFIVHKKSTYVPPHKHLGKSESTHIIEGLVDVVLFNDFGRVDQVISLGDFASRKEFYFRISTPVFHTLLVRSDILVFHETTNGPFSKVDTVFAPWAPDRSDEKACNEFMAHLEQQIKLI